MTDLRKLFIGSLKWELTELELREAFEAFGELEEVKIIMDKETGRSRGFGFIKFKNAEDAKTAVEDMQDFELKGRKLHVSYAESKESRKDARPRNGDSSTEDTQPNGQKRERTRRSD